MEIIVIGLNHKTASIEIRERLAFQESEIEEALREVKFLSSIREAMILSTCNRIELYATSKEIEKAILELKQFLSQFRQFPLEKFERSLYLFIGAEAVRHIFRVASSLDSMVVGEPQILGQIKEAYQKANESNTSGVIFHRLLHRAFHVAKRVRTETKISNSAVSVSSVAVELAQRIFGTLEERTVFLIGAGEMIELAARHLVSEGVKRIIVTNRTFERATALSKEYRGEAIPFEEITVGLKRADIVISATNSPKPLLTSEQIARVMKERKQRPIFFIDIADPRDIEPKVGDLENVYLFNIDDLQKVAYENLKDREKEAENAEKIVEEEVERFVSWYQSLEVTPTIVALRKKFEEIREKELKKMLSLHPELTEKERKSLEAMTSAIINKILHEPITHLKKKDEEAMADFYIDALRTLFQLPDSLKIKEDEDARI
ncbi:MAG: glutamyl-tRNA reductase [Thermodesulfobacteriota bacterium]